MKTPPSVHRRTLRRNGPSARRLEPRMMFDGAAVVDATAAVNDSPTAEHTEAAAAPAPVVDTQTATSQSTQPGPTATETAPSDAGPQTSAANGAAPTSDTGTTQPSGAQPGGAEGNSSTDVAPATGQQSATSSDITVQQTAEPDVGSQSETMRQEAGLANAADVASADAAHLSAVEEQAKQAIASFLGSADGLDKLATLFPGVQTTLSVDWIARAEALRAQVLNGSFNLTVQFVDGAAMGDYYAAFTASGPNGTPTILVNHDWWNVQTDDGTRVRALVEEYGHAIDSRLNPGSDTAGDEGEAFSDKVLNIPVNYVDEARIAVENDHKSVVIDGLSYEVETATLSFLTAYKVYTGAGFLAEKEQNRHHFIDASLGVTVITDGQLSSYFSGNDVVAKVSLNGNDYYGWVSRPIKDQGIVRGFYFWYDANFGNLSTATQDGNMDGDRNAADNNAFILVVDQNYFNNLSVAGSFTDNGVTKTYKFVGSSSDRVDTALNSLVVPNRAPTPSNDSLTILEDSGAGTGNVLTNDSDADGNALAVTGFSINGSAGTLGQAFSIANVGQFTLSADGSYSFTPAANYAGPVPTITYTVSDGQVSATATLSIAITPVNDAPGGTDKTITMDEDTSHTFSAGEFGFTDASDNPANSLQSVVITTLPPAGTLTLNGTAVIAGQEILATDLTKLKFTPATDAFGASYATFTFQVRDSGGTANGGINLDPTPNTITVKVNNVNDAPVAVADTNAINEDAATVTGNVSTNDSDPDGDTRTVVSASGVGATTGSGPFVVVGRYGTLTLQTNGTYSYALDNTNAAVQALRQSTDVLSESFSYTIADPGNLTASSTLTITITARFESCR
ncbi:VCBS repeat-containing protein' /ribosomal slippage [Azospirillum oryzae]|uniref:VCBS repeat-containing protein' /ribosomal slippage n=1 Tax=Azospirillum oryzae TaxID=286727 RepID=A0A1X7G517_9PROT|nr:Ig-like domain-containing protein [Azospirillum oryzae]SMF64099.1 VCBS repeat-containing protein' /ribosomal slippage [Azospirillum oryzae]